MNLMKKSIELNKIIEEVVVSIRDLNEKYNPCSINNCGFMYVHGSSVRFCKGAVR